MATATAQRSKRHVLTGEKVDAVLRSDFPGYWLALNHHRTHKNKRFDLDAYPYLRAPLFDDAQVIVAKKSTQGGWTEMLIAKALGQLERRAIGIFWVLPTGVIKNRFVKNRFDLSVAYTPHYREMMRGEETRLSTFDRAASMSLKHYGLGSLAFVGSNAVSGFGEFPADIGIDDESDYCDQANLPMIEERLSNSELRIRWSSSQPTIDGKGISKKYKESNQGRWYIKGSCGHTIRPEWGKHVVHRIDDLRFEVLDSDWEGLEGPDARMLCDQCGKSVDRFAPGFWEFENPRNLAHGYHFSKLFSGKMTMNEMLARFDKGLTNPVEMQRFENADMGEAHTARGSKIQLEDVQACIGDYPQGRCTGSVVVGVDVGAVLHVAVGELMQDGSTRVVWLGTMPGDANNLADLRELVGQYKMAMGVIDERPETRMARRLAYGSRRWWMCRYTEGKRDTVDARAKVIAVDRTIALDAVNEAVMLGQERLKLPADSLAVDGFEAQMLALTRVYDPLRNRGEGGYVWDGDEADHFCFAAGTMVMTIEGEKPIESINSSDRILTRKGFRKVLSHGMTGIKETTFYELAGKNIECTPDHKIWTRHGFKAACLLTPLDTCYVMSSEVNELCAVTRLMRLFLTEPNLDAIRKQKGEAIEFITRQAERIERKASEDFMRKYGRPPMGRFQRDLSSITKMGIRSITISRILSARKIGSIGRIMVGSIMRRIEREVSIISTRYGHYQKLGIERRKEKNGIAIMPGRWILAIGSMTRFVFNVERNFLLALSGGNSALIRVSRKREELRESIMRSERVNCAELHSSPTNTRRLDSVLGAARESTILQPVYNIEVKGQHEYFANGILVSNCHAIGYMLLARRMVVRR